MAREPSVEVSNDQKASRTSRTGFLWLSLFVLLLNGSWAIYHFQYNNLPIPLTAEQAGKRGFSEVLALAHVKNLTGFGPHPVGSNALDLAIQPSTILYVDFGTRAVVASLHKAFVMGNKTTSIGLLHKAFD